MFVRGYIACVVYYVAVLLSIKFGEVKPDPVPAQPAIWVGAPDASVPPPPEPTGDCGEWSDDELCET